jgi:hypothetical protein
MARKSKSLMTLLRKIDLTAGAELDEWATVENGAVTGWVSDPTKATLITMSAACRIQADAERAPEESFVAMRRDDVTAAGITGARLEWVSDDC